MAIINPEFVDEDMRQPTTLRPKLSKITRKSRTKGVMAKQSVSNAI
jgi:hypothetical protein